ncbi:response regulator [Azospirillum agricola]|uniref:response regulator n=1 Tax=Azospirillum agricola TaxID=1720247 RepID=UPI000A0EFED0|nr:response regulator [Azospirillum agricola]SMH53504.1 Response regulator receiver domain-containing protein [Azospirillum lipoferum]
MDSTECSDRLAVIIDDEAIILAGMEIMLETWGYRVVAVEDAASALAALAEAPPEAPPPSVIVSDYRLRNGVSGVDAVRAVREAAGAAVPAIILTGDTGAALAAAAQREDFLVLHKPVQPAELRRQIDRLVEAA